MILSNPPFVAVPPAGHTCAACGVHAEWPLYADGGVDGMAVLRRVVVGAARLLREGGYLMATTELANPAVVHAALARAPPSTHSLEICVAYNPRHTQSAEAYATDRASERIGASATAWAE